MRGMIALRSQVEMRGKLDATAAGQRQILQRLTADQG
jgi:hypothetical protein